MEPFTFLSPIKFQRTVQTLIKTAYEDINQTLSETSEECDENFTRPCNLTAEVHDETNAALIEMLPNVIETLKGGWDNK